MCIWVKDGNTKRWNGLGWKIFTSFFVWSFSPSDISCEKIEPTLKEQMKRKRKIPCPLTLYCKAAAFDGTRLPVAGRKRANSVCHFYIDHYSTKGATKSEKKTSKTERTSTEHSEGRIRPPLKKSHGRMGFFCDECSWRDDSDIVLSLAEYGKVQRGGLQFQSKSAHFLVSSMIPRMSFENFLFFLHNQKNKVHAKPLITSCFTLKHTKSSQ